MKDYYKISEISRLYGIGADSLRYYERAGIITPKRGENGYCTSQQKLDIRFF